ncbi:hypothetical protein LCGC14_0488770 [marine sediment metagenome]|uniref:Uncharacterized protein n=1 Tax=marine sediment metagenome TaxID=412755 RepID=A0A0F9S752_9ZZZZ
MGKYRNGHCFICGYNETIDIHHEGKERVEYSLCPNCHALITRGIKTLAQLVAQQKVKRLKPKARRTGRNSTVVSLRLPDSVYTIVKEMADKKGVTVTAFIKAKIEEYARLAGDVQTSDPGYVVIGGQMIRKVT